MTWSRSTAVAGSAVVTLASCRIRIVRGHREPPRNCGRWRLAPADEVPHFLLAGADETINNFSCLLRCMSPNDQWASRAWRDLGRLGVCDLTRVLGE
jgi:hypothetical protein